MANQSWMMHPDAALADRVEAEAMRDMYAAAPAALRLEAKATGGATLLIAPTIPASFFNRAIGFGVERRAGAADLDAIVSSYRTAGVAEYWIHRTPGAAPDDIVVTETGEPMADEPNASLANIRRAGFRQVASRLNYAAPKPAG